MSDTTEEGLSDTSEERLRKIEERLETLWRLRAENSALRDQVVLMQEKLEGLREELEIEWWSRFHSCPEIGPKGQRWRLPCNSNEFDACAELEAIGKLERHKKKDWFREVRS